MAKIKRFTATALMLVVTMLALFTLVGPPAQAAARPSSAGSWSLTGSLHVGRDGHAAILLKNGKVLVAGGMGLGPERFLSSAELYSPGQCDDRC